MAEEKKVPTKNESDDIENTAATSPIVPVEVAIKEVKESGLAKTFVLSLLDIRNDLIENTRTDCTGDHVENIRTTIGDNMHNEQLNPINATIVTKDGKEFVSIYAGFTRYEAMCRTALLEVIEKWNKDNELDPKDDNYIAALSPKGYEAQKDREKILLSGGEWAKLYNEALGKFPVKVEIMPVLNSFSSFYKSFVENNARENLPAWNTASVLQEMKKRFNVTWKIIAAKVGMKQQTISQYNAIWSIPEHLTEMFEEDKEGLKLTETDKKMVTICKDEFVRRASLPVKDPRAIQMSHGRILGQALSQRSSNNINFKDGIKLVSALCKINPDGSLNQNADTAVYGVFESLIANVKAKKTADATSGLVTSDDALAKMFDSSVTTGDIADLQKSNKDDAAAEFGITAEGELDMSAIMNAVTTQKTKEDSVTETGKPASATLIEEDLIPGSTGIDDIVDDDSDDDDDDESSLIDADADDLLSGVVDTSSDALANMIGEAASDLTVSEKEKELTGEKRTGTIDVTGTELKIKPVDKIIEKISIGKILATTCIEDADDATTVNWIEFLSTLSGAVSLTEIIGDKANNKKLSPIVNAVSEALRKVWIELINHAKKTMNAEQFQKISSILPKIEIKDELEE